MKSSTLGELLFDPFSVLSCAFRRATGNIQVSPPLNKEFCSSEIMYNDFVMVRESSLLDKSHVHSEHHRISTWAQAGLGELATFAATEPY